MISTFNQIRDVPYRIPLSTKEPDACCSGKAKLLKEALEKEYKVRYRVVDFLWSELGLPKELLSVKHEDNKNS